MKLFDRIFRRRTKSLMGDEASILASMFSRMGRGGIESERLTDPWRQNPFVRSGVSAIYRAVRGIPVQVVTGDKGGEDDPTPVKSTHPLAMLVASPCPFMSGSEMWASIVAWKKLDGEAFAICYGEGDALWTVKSGDYPRELCPINPRVVRIDENDIDRMSGLVRFWTVTDRFGVESKIPAESMLQFKDFDPRDMLRSHTPLESVWSDMDADRNVGVYSQAMLSNLGSVGAILKLKVTPSPEEEKALLAAWNDHTRGASKAGKTRLLGPDVDLEPGNAHTAKDMEAPKLREDARDRVKAVLGVTDYEVGRIADYNRANSEAAMAWMLRRTILPELSSIEEVLWSRICEPLSRNDRVDTWVRFDLDSVQELRPDLLTAAQTANSFVTAGYTAESVSDKLELGLDVAPPEPPPEVVPPGLPATKAAPVAPLSRPIALKIQRQWSKHAERKIAVRWRKFTNERYAEAVTKTRNLADIGRVNSGVLDDVLGNEDLWRVGSKNAIGNVFDGLGKRLAANVGRELARDTSESIAWKTAALRRVGQLVNVSTAMRRRIRMTLTKAIDDFGADFTAADLERALKERFGDRLPGNAATIARTEAGIFANDVRHQMMRDAGVSKRTWLGVMDDAERDTHAAIEGEVRGIEERFSNGLLYPMEAGGPPGQVVNCRCVAMPVIAKG